MDADELTDDEYTVLLIAVQGESMIPIGRWEVPIKNLAKRGLMFRHDDVNYGITYAGRAAARTRETQDDRQLGRALEMAPAIQNSIRDFAEQAAQLLAKAAIASAAVTTDTPEQAVRKWSEVIRKRAVELL